MNLELILKHGYRGFRNVLAQIKRLLKLLCDCILLDVYKVHMFILVKTVHKDGYLGSCVSSITQFF